MNKPYKEYKEAEVRVCIQRISDGAFIPLDPDNSDYAEFIRLASLQGESNILEAAE